MKYNSLVLSILFILFVNNTIQQSLTQKNNGDTCTSSFECNIGCCYEGKCEDKAMCEKRITNAYIISGISSIIVIVIILIVLYLQIKDTKQNVTKIKAKIELKKKDEEERLTLARCSSHGKEHSHDHQE